MFNDGGPSGNCFPTGSTPSAHPPPHISGFSTMEPPTSQPHIQPISSSGGHNYQPESSISKIPVFESQPSRSSQIQSSPSAGSRKTGRERNMSVSDRRALLKLDFLIIGGGGSNHHIAQFGSVWRA